MTANIINIKNEWPLSNRDLYKYAENKYGITGLSQIHHYETKEVKDSQGRLILPAGKVVDEDFEVEYYDTTIVTVSGDNVRDAITNYEYESRENTKKSSIYLLKPGYLQQFINDMRDIMIYGQSSEYVNDKLIKTENTRVISQ